MSSKETTDEAVEYKNGSIIHDKNKKSDVSDPTKELIDSKFNELIKYIDDGINSVNERINVIDNSHDDTECMNYNTINDRIDKIIRYFYTSGAIVLALILGYLAGKIFN